MRWAFIVGMTILALGPLRLTVILHNLLGLWDFALLIGVAATLLYFFYWFFLRRILRARRIANLRWRRMMDERMDEHRNQQNPAS